MATGTVGSPSRATAGKTVLATLAAAQFLMALDSSVMNVSIATVASDVGTTVTGIQGAITAYTLVMAMFMLPGGKVGAMIGRKRAFTIGCVVYGCGSLTTALAPNLTVLLLGWSLLEGLGAALILPAVVALVALNFPTERRPTAYGLIAASAAVAIGLGPLIGGIATTYFSWRWVFAGEVAIVAVILALARHIADRPSEGRPRFDVIGAVLSATGLGLFVYGVLRTSEWGWFVPKAGAPSWLGMSASIWVMLAGVLVVWLFLLWQSRVLRRGGDPLVDPGLFANRQLSGGLIMFFLQFLVQMGVFFVVPLYLSVALGLSAIRTGVHILPLSLSLLAAASLIPKLFPRASPRLIVRLGVLSLFAGALSLAAALNADSSAAVVTIPLLLIGLGMGALASQLGAVTVSAVPDSRSAEVGGVQNTVTNLGSSIGTALAGSILIGTLTSSFLSSIEKNPAVPASVSAQASTKLAAGAPFLSDSQLSAALTKANVPPEQAQAAMQANSAARLVAVRAAVAILALVALIAMVFTGRIPNRQPGAPGADSARSNKSTKNVT
ncbi:major facilitator superfamily MFS_1 [Catenulispora acidiphila DSM 44928]|uniref:Major facilitator superfamily MFS_1 n=1 Tax=Catenulispora acidiphila (strain DSM 44928 / JCM 14897 / NBRC 102108 / NRRL B-24433 / ID139908) TaxID=479433 RepID=C7PYG2_CATAD|nr:MFS transporter [Catenulispora acidiphila]ACU75452.1 major facilitator superfamily MFS_1 [Catenulispora acidiphila DSM 44928]